MRERLDQISRAWQLTRANDPRLPWLVFGPMVVVVALGVVATLVTGGYLWMLLSVSLALLLGPAPGPRPARSPADSSRSLRR